MKKYISIPLLSVICYLLSFSFTNAVCPVCTVGVVAGLGLSRWLGVDDTISGIWIGGLLISLTGWTINWLKARKISFKGMAIITALVYYAFVVIPLYWKEVIGHPFNELWGIDKLILGIAFGTVIFVIAVLVYEIMKKKNNGHAHFPFEKIVIPISSLIILSSAFYFITK